MMTRSLLVALAAGGFVAFAGPSTPAVAAPVPVLAPPDEVSLVQEAGITSGAGVTATRMCARR